MGREITTFTGTEGSITVVPQGSFFTTQGRWEMTSFPWMMSFPSLKDKMVEAELGLGQRSGLI